MLASQYALDVALFKSHNVELKCETCNLKGFNEKTKTKFIMEYVWDL